MLEPKILKKINNMLSVAIELLEIDFDSSLIITRKVLESVLKTIYQLDKIEHPLGQDGYTTPDLMLKDLLDRKLITQPLYNCAEYVRKKGNHAAHYSDSKTVKSDAKESLKSMSILCEWFLKKYKMTNTSLYYLVLRHARINKKVISDKKVLKNIKCFEEYLRLSVFKNNLRVFDLYDELDFSFFVDPLLREFINETYNLAEKYYNWKEEFDPTDYEQGFFERIWNGTQRSITPKEAFMEYYEYQVEGFEELKNKVKHKYLL